MRKPRAVQPALALRPGLPGRRIHPFTRSGCYLSVAHLLARRSCPRRASSILGPSQSPAPPSLWSPPAEPLGRRVPSQVVGSSPYPAVDNVAERVGVRTLNDEKLQVKRHFRCPQGYPPEFR